MDKYQLHAIRSWFRTYTDAFEGNDPDLHFNFQLKRHHTARVAHLAALFMEDDSLKLLAEAAGLLHDVGRFEQYARYRTFVDRESVNHAELGGSVIVANRVLADIDDTEALLLLKAVGTHNLRTIPDELQGATRCVTEVLRDADKLDILSIQLENFVKPPHEREQSIVLGLPDISLLSEHIIPAILRRESVENSSLRSVNDFKLLLIGWFYDLNTVGARKMFIAENIAEKVAATLPVDSRIDQLVAQIRRDGAGKLA